MKFVLFTISFFFMQILEFSFFSFSILFFVFCAAHSALEQNVRRVGADKVCGKKNEMI